jgi:hypothetical protein
MKNIPTMVSASYLTTSAEDMTHYLYRFSDEHNSFSADIQLFYSPYAFWDKHWAYSWLPVMEEKPTRSVRISYGLRTICIALSDGVNWISLFSITSQLHASQIERSKMSDVLV